MRTYTQEEKQAPTQKTAIQDSRTEGRGICLEGRGFIRHVQSDKGVR